jgi:23S rRNA G2445 N2-methylase RlmL
MFGPEMEELFNKVKHIFDPENIFNPHKKVGVDFNYIKEHVRHEYSIKSLEHLEREQAQDAIDR